MVTLQEKQRITEAVGLHIERYGGLNKAAHSLKKVSPATLHQITKEIWEQISDTMWRNIGTQLGISGKDWIICQTANYKRIQRLMEDAQEDAKVFGMIGDAGCGKTKALESYTLHNTDAYYVCCREYWDRKTFLREVLRIVGHKTSGKSISQMMDELVFALKVKNSPLLIFDEADKLPDHVLCFFITLYNLLEDHCGIVLAATEHLQNRIDRGRRLNRKGYEEMYSRLGRKFIFIAEPSTEDVAHICMANGLDHKDFIKEVIEDSKADLRRVSRKVYAIKKKLERNQTLAEEAIKLLSEALVKQQVDKYTDAVVILEEDNRFNWKGLAPLLDKWSKLREQAEKDFKNKLETV